MKGSTTKIAQALRSNATDAEKYLWYILRLKNLGFKFRRQTVIGPYIVDFICFEKGLIVAEYLNHPLPDPPLKGEGKHVARTLCKYRR